MPSGIVRNPVRPGDDFKARQKLELDRLRTAIAIVERMRQAGICCELYNDVKNGNRSCIELLVRVIIATIFEEIFRECMSALDH